MSAGSHRRASTSKLQPHERSSTVSDIFTGPTHDSHCMRLYYMYVLHMQRDTRTRQPFPLHMSGYNESGWQIGFRLVARFTCSHSQQLCLSLVWRASTRCSRRYIYRILCIIVRSESWRPDENVDDEERFMEGIADGRRRVAVTMAIAAHARVMEGVMEYRSVPVQAVRALSCISVCIPRTRFFHRNRSGTAQQRHSDTIWE